jgi:hypothetical protein
MYQVAHVGLAAACIGVAVAIPCPADAVPNTRCVLTTPVQEVRSVTQLPPDLLRLFPPIADVGAPWNATDSVSDPTLPFRRLIRAGSHGSDWFVWYEQGGVGYSWHAVVARVVPGAQPAVLANAGTIADTLCTLTDGAFAGTVPPYPPGTWASVDF